MELKTENKTHTQIVSLFIVCFDGFFLQLDQEKERDEVDLGWTEAR